MKLSNYISPLYMGYSYEEKQGPQHNQLAQEIKDTSFYLNSTVTTLRHEVSELASSHSINIYSSCSECSNDYYTATETSTFCNVSLVQLFKETMY